MAEASKLTDHELHCSGCGQPLSEAARWCLHCGLVSIRHPQRAGLCFEAVATASAAAMASAPTYATRTAVADPHLRRTVFTLTVESIDGDPVTHAGWIELDGTLRWADRFTGPGAGDSLGIDIGKVIGEVLRSEDERPPT